jgi:outer membrane protein assembly factor BamB
MEGKKNCYANATPCTDGKYVFNVTAKGAVFALDIGTGALVWQTDILKECGWAEPSHGIASSPMLVGNVLTLSQGAGMDKNTGKVLWHTEKVLTSWNSHVAWSAGNEAFVVISGAANLSLLDATGGQQRWNASFGGSYQYLDPMLVGDRILVPAAGGRLYRLDATKAVEADAVKGKPMGMSRFAYANPVVWNGYVFSPWYSDNDRTGMFQDPELSRSGVSCFDLNTGKRMWDHSGIVGTLIVCDGKIIMQGQYGDVRVVETSPEGYRELANAKIFANRNPKQANTFVGATYCTPILSNGRLYLRSQKPGEVTCLDVSHDYPDPWTPNPTMPDDRIVGELYTVTGILAAKDPTSPAFAVAVLKEDATGAAYTLCVRENSNRPGMPKRVAELLETKATVAVTGVLLYDNNLTVSAIDERK